MTNIDFVTATTTNNPAMWEDVKGYLLQENGEGFELEDQSRYIMLESWFGDPNPWEYLGEWEDYLSRDISKARRRLRRQSWPTNL